jgi:hypothetical protein
LSYTWGPEAPFFSISIDHASFQVRNNLHDFLEIFCREIAAEVEWIWIDQICINQDDIPERNMQVAIMKMIYWKATGVISWLGKADGATSIIEDLIPVLEKSMETNVSLWQDMGPVHAALKGRSVNSLMNNMYWTRVWVVQEVYLAKTIRIQWGSASLTGQQLIKLSEGFDNNIMTILWTHDQRSLNYPFLTQPAAMDDFNRPIQFTKGTACFDPRDHVYGLQGLVAWPDTVKVDYDKPLEEVYLDAAEVIVRRNFAAKFHAGMARQTLQELATRMGLLRGTEEQRTKAVAKAVEEYETTWKDRGLSELDARYSDGGYTAASRDASKPFFAHAKLLRDILKEVLNLTAQS